jgi:hypothetical protein
MFQYDPRFSRQLHEERVVGPDYAHLAPSGEDSRHRHGGARRHGQDPAPGGSGCP